MWRLYGFLQNGLVGNEKEYLIDTVSDMLDGMTRYQFSQSLQLLYPNLMFDEVNPVETLTLFIRGLKHNKVFLFADTVKGLNGSSKR